MTLQEAVKITKENNNGLIPIAGYETEHFYVFTALAYKKDDPVSSDQMFVIDKGTKETGYVYSSFLALCTPGLDSGWEKFKEYDSNEIIRDSDLDNELQQYFK